MEKFRLILNRLQNCIEQGNGATEGWLKGIWNELSDAITEQETNQVTSKGKESSHERAALHLHDVTNRRELLIIFLTKIACTDLEKCYWLPNIPDVVDTYLKNN